MIGRVGRMLLAPVRRVTVTWRTTRRTAALLPDAVEAILVLPALSHQLAAIRVATATLPEMHAEIARVRGDTSALPEIERTLAGMAVLLDRIEQNTAGVEQLTEVLVPLRGAALRVGRLTERWPNPRSGALQPTGGGRSVGATPKEVAP